MTVAVKCACLPAIPTIYRAKFSPPTTVKSSNPAATASSASQSRRRASTDKHLGRQGVEEVELERGNLARSSDGRDRSSDESLNLDGGHGAEFTSEVKGGKDPGSSEEELVGWARVRGQVVVGRDGIVRTVEIRQSDEVNQMDSEPHAL